MRLNTIRLTVGAIAVRMLIIELQRVGFSLEQL